MTTALAPLTVSADQLDLVKRTVATGATDAELKLYLYDCQRHGVHPLDKLLHFTKRGGKYTPVTSIDLMRMRAADTGECIGISDPVFDAGPIGGGPASATVTVKRLVQGHEAYFTATARWSEYYPGDAQGHMWKRMPHTMLGKCAEALALRKGFPKQLSGLYAREEMDQADAAQTSTVVAPVVLHTPAGEVNVITGEVVAADGALRVTRVESRTTTTGKARWLVVLSDGREAWTFSPQLSALAEALTQEQAPVVVETADQGKWGLDLKALARVPSNQELDAEIAKAEDPYAAQQEAF